METRDKNSWLFRCVLWLGILSVLCTVLINLFMARDYLQLDRKSRHFFGIHEFYEYWYQYAVALFGCTALFLIIPAGFTWQPPRKFARLLTFLLFAMVLIFLRIWRWFVWLYDFFI
jgi:hypothetical protein